MKRRYGALISLALLAIVAIALVSGIVVSPFARADPVGRVIPVGAHPTSIVVDSATGRAFVLNEAGNSVSVIDTAGGTSIATVPVGVGPRALMVDARRSRVFVLSNAEQTVIDGRYVSYMSPNRPGQVNALDASTGQKIWTRDVGMAPDDMALDAQGARVFVANRLSKTVSVLDTRTGRPVRTVRVRWDPIAVVVDERTGHALVLSAGGGSVPTPAPDRWAWLPGPIRARLPFLPRPAVPAPSARGSVTIVDASF